MKIIYITFAWEDLKFQAAVVNNVSTLSETGDYGAIGDAGRAWVVVRKYN
jgi:hypothetical protein